MRKGAQSLRRSERPVNTVRILAFGLLGIATALTVCAVVMWQNDKQEKQGLIVLRTMTPERLIANCGQPFSDSTADGLHLKVLTRVGSPSGTAHLGPYIALTRSVEYRGAKFPHWVKLEFIRDIDNRGQPTAWRLTHFASPSVGVSPSDDNAYIAIPEFRCMAQPVE